MQVLRAPRASAVVEGLGRRRRGGAGEPDGPDAGPAAAAPSGAGRRARDDAASRQRALAGVPDRADLSAGLDNLLLHKLRTLLTMLGMIFGVAAVLSMLSIGAGAQQQVMAFIEDLGVRNLIVEARETTECQALQKVRSSRPASPSRTCAPSRPPCPASRS